MDGGRNRDENKRDVPHSSGSVRARCCCHKVLLSAGKLSAQSGDAHVFVSVASPLDLTPSPSFITLSLADQHRPYYDWYAGLGAFPC